MSYSIGKNGNLLSYTIPFRWSLFVVFALLVVIISIATLTVSFIETSQLVNDMSNSLITRTQRQTEVELQRLFTPITNQVAVAHRWVQNGLVKRYDTDALMSLFLPGMFQLPQCVSMMVSDMHGYEFTIFRNESGGQFDIPEGQAQWTTRDFRREEWGKTALWTLWDENGANRLKQWKQDTVWDKSLVAKFSPSGTEKETITEEALIYDPRPRSWHQGARDRYHAWTTAEIVRNPREAIYWTDIDMFFTSKAPGITASIAVKDPEGELVVIAYDLLLRDLSVFTRELQPTEHGKTFVFTGTGKIVGVPRDERLQNEEILTEKLLTPVEDIGIPELAPFIEGWRARQSDDVTLFQSKSGGQVWWAGFCPFPVNTDRALWIGVLIPESDLLTTARQNRMTILGIGLSALLLAMLLAWVLSHNLTHPLNALVQQSNRIVTLELSPGSPVKSRLTEIVALSHSLEIMRTSLKQHITEQREVEGELRENEARYRNMFANNHAVMLLIDPETAEIVDANPAACAFYGYNHTELTRYKITDINTLSQVEVFAELQHAKSEERHYFLFRHRLANGEIRDVEVYSGPIQLHARSLLYSIIHDVTERHRAEEALRASEAKYRMLFEEALTPIMVVDETGTYLDANAAALQFLECCGEELLQKKVWDFSPPGILEQQQAEHAPFVGRRTLETDYDVHGTIKTLLLNVVPLTLSGQTILYGIGQDITERKRALEALRHREQEFKTLIEHTPDVIARFDRHYRHIYVNPAVEEEFGDTPDEILGKTHRELGQPPDMAEWSESIIRQVFESAQELVFELRLPAPDGDRYYLSRGVPEFAEDGSVVSALFIHRNITDRKRAEEHIQQLNAELEERVRQRTTELEAVNRDLQDFIRLSTHDLKTPLRGIGQLAYWLSDDYANCLDVEGQRWISLLISRVKRMDRLLDGMVEYSQIGHISPHPEWIDLNTLVQRGLAAISPPEHIRVVVEDDLPGIISEQKHLYNVFYHLLQNAITFLDKPEGIITIGCLDEGEYWRFRISDNGPGIAAKYHEKIFQIFQTLEPKDRREHTGIGLALVKKIVELHSGNIRVESTIGQGSTFWFTWPKKRDVYGHATDNESTGAHSDSD